MITVPNPASLRDPDGFRSQCDGGETIDENVTTRSGLVNLGFALLAVLLFAACQGAQESGESNVDLTLDLYLAGTDLTMNVTRPPIPGQKNMVAGDLHLIGGTGQAPEPDGEPIGRFFGQCTVVTQRESACTGLVTLDGRGTITLQVGVVGGVNQGIALTGGTGEFNGARGSGSEPSVPGHPEDRLLHLTFSTIDRS